PPAGTPSASPGAPSAASTAPAPAPPTGVAPPPASPTGVAPPPMPPAPTTVASPPAAPPTGVVGPPPAAPTGVVASPSAPTTGVAPPPAPAGAPPRPAAMQLPVLDRLILGAQKPSRYAGGELNAVHKRLDEVALRWVLAFPDTYEVGMSNVGFRLLYHALNERPEVACERFFMPWADMESALRAEGLPLFSIESRAPLRAFDVLGFTLQFELCYTTVLAMLELGGVPLATSERGRDDPLVLGGGPCAYNPEPVADFFDALVVGEGEEA